MKVLLVFLMSFLTAGITLARETLAHFGVDTNVLLVTLIAIVIAGLLAHRKLLLVVLVCGMSLTINLPPEILQSHGIKKDVLVIVLMTIIVLPIITKFLDRQKPY